MKINNITLLFICYLTLTLHCILYCINITLTEFRSNIMQWRYPYILQWQYKLKSQYFYTLLYPFMLSIKNKISVNSCTQFLHDRTSMLLHPDSRGVSAPLWTLRERWSSTLVLPHTLRRSANLLEEKYSHGLFFEKVKVWWNFGFFKIKFPFFKTWKSSHVGGGWSKKGFFLIE